MGNEANSPCAPLLVKDTGCYDDGRTRVGTVALAMGGGLLICITLDEMCSLWTSLQLSIFAHARKHYNTIWSWLLSFSLPYPPHSTRAMIIKWGGQRERGHPFTYIPLRLWISQTTLLTTELVFWIDRDWVCYSYGQAWNGLLSKLPRNASTYTRGKDSNSKGQGLLGTLDSWFWGRNLSSWSY